MENSDIFLGLVTLVVLILGWFLNRLAESDYIMLSDYAGSDTSSWANYRQQLRDLTNVYTETATPVFPAIP
jgi:hypothetical protein